MRYKATFLSGFAAGYVLGTKAGRERYELIMRGVRSFVDTPAVQETAGLLQAQATRAAGTVAGSMKHAVTDRVTGRFGGRDVSADYSAAGAYPTMAPSSNGGPRH